MKKVAIVLGVILVMRNFVFRSHPISFLGATRFPRRDPLRSVSDDFFSFFHELAV